MIRDIRTLRNHPPVLRADRCDPLLFGESLKIRVDDNVNLAGKDIRFREERKTVTIFDDFEKHSAETFFCLIFRFIYFILLFYFFHMLIYFLFVLFCLTNESLKTWIILDMQVEHIASSKISR